MDEGVGAGVDAGLGRHFDPALPLLEEHRLQGVDDGGHPQVDPFHVLAVQVEDGIGFHALPPVASGPAVLQDSRSPAGQARRGRRSRLTGEPGIGRSCSTPAPTRMIRNSSPCLPLPLPLAVIPPAGASDMWNVGTRRQLFVDERFIERSEGVRLCMNPPVQHPEPVLVPDRPWESHGIGAYNTAMLEPDGRFRLWYDACVIGGGPAEGARRLCYAESADGLAWTKPDLGLIEFRGARANNIVAPRLERQSMQGATVLRDEAAPRGGALQALDEVPAHGRGDGGRRRARSVGHALARRPALELLRRPAESPGRLRHPEHAVRGRPAPLLRRLHAGERHPAPGTRPPRPAASRTAASAASPPPTSATGRRCRSSSRRMPPTSACRCRARTSPGALVSTSTRAAP